MDRTPCSEYSDVDRTNLVISIIIAIGIVVSYLPQHIRIYTRRSSEGLSPFFLLLGITSCTNALLNVSVLQWRVLQCCSELSPGVCFANILGAIQLLLQFVMFGIVYITSVTAEYAKRLVSCFSWFSSLGHTISPVHLPFQFQYQNIFLGMRLLAGICLWPLQSLLLLTLSPSLRYLFLSSANQPRGKRLWFGQIG